MRLLRRARLGFVAAIAIAVVIVATQFPLGELVHARAALSFSSTHLAQLRRENASLGAQVKALQQGSTIEQIAHQEYGLVRPGQQAVVVLPGAHESTGATASGRLGTFKLPSSDFVPTDSLLSPGATAAKPATHEGLWRKVLNRLEFWKATT